MRYVQLRAFHYVAISGGFSRAADALGLTQPAVSDQVRKLETEYDIRLFDRERKQVVLTSAGQKLLEITHRLFDVEEQALEYLSSSKKIKTGRLVIVADSAHHILHILARFRADYPAVFVSVSIGNTETVLERLKDYSADIGVLGEMPDSKAHMAVKLSSQPIIAFAARTGPHGHHRSVTMEELTAMPLVMRESGSKTRAKFEDHARNLGLEPRIRIEAQGREAVRQIVASGDGVGIVSRAEFGDHPNLTALPISDADLTMDEAVLCLRERQDSRLIRAFMQIAVQEAAPDLG